MVVGTRSAVFAPVSDLALIIVDEEHDSSYKQEETPRYHARDVAVVRAKMANAVVVLGSATPSLESYFNAKKNKYALVELPDRVEQRPLPEVEIVDMRQEFQETGEEQLFSRALLAETRATLERGEQAIILLNRRGYSFAVLCRSCGEKLQCENCAIALTNVADRTLFAEEASSLMRGTSGDDSTIRHAAAAATVRTAPARSSCERTTPPAPTRPRPTSNCGFTISAKSAPGAAQATSAGSTRVSEMNDRSATTTSGGGATWAGSSARTLTRSSTVTRSSVRSDQASWP